MVVGRSGASLAHPFFIRAQPFHQVAHNALTGGHLAAFGGAVDDCSFLLYKLMNFVVNGVLGQQVPGGNGVRLTYAVTSVLGLIVRGRCPT